jgi:WG containing repeat
MVRPLFRLSLVFVVATAFFLLLLGRRERPGVRIERGLPGRGAEHAAGLHPIFRDGKWGYVDNHGEVVITPQFDWAVDFVENRAGVAIWGKWEKIGFIRPDGSWTKLLPAEAYASGHFSEGRAWFIQWGLRGCIDGDGNVRVPPRYHDAQEYSGGLARVGRRISARGRGRDRAEEWRYGYVDLGGDEVLPLQYADAGPFVDGLARTKRPGMPGYEFIDRTGAVVFSLPRTETGSELTLSDVTDFKDGRASASYSRSTGLKPKMFARLLDVRGGRVGPDLPEIVPEPFSEGLAYVLDVHRKVGFIDLEGRFVVRPIFDDAGDFREGRCRVQVGSKWEYIDRKGLVVAKPAGEGTIWNDADDFMGGLARVHVGGKMSEGTAHTASWWEGGTWYYIDGAGAIVTVCRHDGTRLIEPPLGMEHRGE